MKKITDYLRVERLIKNSIDSFSLNLKGMNVLTEAASGSFVVTQLVAALAGADSVISIARDSRYGSFSEVKEYTEWWIDKLKINKDIIKITSEKPSVYAKNTNIVTNLGFVRPIDNNIINELPYDSAVSLMWETWEFRASDLDLESCIKRNIPVLGTSETYPNLDIFKYVALLPVKLLLEVNIEISRTNILVIGSSFFGIETKSMLQTMGANVFYLDPTGSWKPKDNQIKDFLKNCDAIVLTEHNTDKFLIGGETGIPVEWLENTGIKLIHICGSINYPEINKLQIEKNPSNEVKNGFMTLTTDYLGPKPVIDLHTAGLKVGESLVTGMRMYKERNKAIEYALNNSPAMDFIK